MKYYISRPLLRNVKHMDNAEIVKCDLCGEKCWKRPELEEQVTELYGKDSVIPCCTECAIRGMSNHIEERNAIL